LDLEIKQCKKKRKKDFFFKKNSPILKRMKKWVIEIYIWMFRKKKSIVWISDIVFQFFDVVSLTRDLALNGDNFKKNSKY
jgi:hypothetical protein